MQRMKTDTYFVLCACVIFSSGASGMGGVSVDGGFRLPFLYQWTKEGKCQFVCVILYVLFVLYYMLSCDILWHLAGLLGWMSCLWWVIFQTNSLRLKEYDSNQRIEMLARAPLLGYCRYFANPTLLHYASFLLTYIIVIIIIVIIIIIILLSSSLSLLLLLLSSSSLSSFYHPHHRHHHIITFIIFITAITITIIIIIIVIIILCNY